MFLLCGEALFDFFCDESRVAPDAATIDFHAVAGGSPMNVAIGLARLDAGQRRAMVRFAMGAAADTCARRGPDLPSRNELTPLSEQAAACR